MHAATEHTLNQYTNNLKHATIFIYYIPQTLHNDTFYPHTSCGHATNADQHMLANMCCPIPTVLTVYEHVRPFNCGKLYAVIGWLCKHYGRVD